MKITLQYILIIFLIVITSAVGYCEENKIWIYYGNGILNEEEDAQESKDIIEELMIDKIQGTNLSGKLKYGISHNPTEGFLEDLYESASQVLGLMDRQIWRFLSGLDIMPDDLRERYISIASQVTQDMIKDSPAIQEHVKKYNERLCAGDKVLVVAHSQGNLYANVAYTAIELNVIDGFGIVSVANPDYYVAGNGPYTSIYEDQLIGAVPTALPRNLDNFDANVNYLDLIGHNFIDSYMAIGHPAESKILNDIISTINQLAWPQGECPKDYLIATSFIYNSSSQNQKGSPEYIIVWDMANNKMAENIPLDNGGVATFPCNKELISNWLLQGTFSQNSVISTSYSKYRLHLLGTI